MTFYSSVFLHHAGAVRWEGLKLTLGLKWKVTTTNFPKMGRNRRGLVEIMEWMDGSKIEEMRLPSLSTSYREFRDDCGDEGCSSFPCCAFLLFFPCCAFPSTFGGPVKNA